MDYDVVWNGDVHAPHRGLLTLPVHATREAPSSLPPAIVHRFASGYVHRERGALEPMVREALREWRTTGEIAALARCSERGVRKWYQRLGQELEVQHKGARREYRLRSAA